jgi:uncharacterized protein (TIGR03435 family)
MSNHTGAVTKLKLAACALFAAVAFGQSRPPSPRPAFDAFEVATVKLTSPDDYGGGRVFRMPSAHQFAVKNFSLRLLIGLAFNLTPRAITGGPAWVDSDHYDILAATPGEVRPSFDEQMSMLRSLLTERFKLTFHHEKKEFSIYTIAIAKTGLKLKESAPSDEPPSLISTVFPASSGGIDHISMPATNATMAQFAAVLQRAVLDRPVVDLTGLSAKYDFDLEWTPDDTQFGGNLPPGPPDSPKASLYAAIQEQLGLKLEATRGPIETLVVDHVEKPSAN